MSTATSGNKNIVARAEQEIHDLLHKMAEHEGLPKSVMVRRAIVSHAADVLPEGA